MMIGYDDGEDDGDDDGDDDDYTVMSNQRYII